MWRQIRSNSDWEKYHISKTKKNKNLKEKEEKGKRGHTSKYVQVQQVAEEILGWGEPEQDLVQIDEIHLGKIDEIQYLGKIDEIQNLGETTNEMFENCWRKWFCL